MENISIIDFYKEIFDMKGFPMDFLIDSKGNKITSSINHLDTIFWFSPKYGFIKEYFGDYGIAVFREDILAKK
mgnify:CR=1 FL=1